MDRSLHLRARRRLGLAAVLAVACTVAWPMQGGGSLQTAHYVLVKALSSGTATIDRALAEVDTVTNDTMLHDGRLYSNKPPGFAAAGVPGYVVLRELGVDSAGDPTRMLWALGLVTVVAPAALLLVLVRRIADALEPGFGTAAAVVLGLGTLVLPFATLFLSHLLSALLAFAAFALLWEERRRAPDARLVAAAGVLAGLAVVVEYSNALAAALVGAYALARAPGVRRAAVYAGCVLAGALPLLAYNTWAFGEPFASSYAADASGASSDLFGAPRLDVLLQLFLSQHGLLVGSPVLACALAGIVLLARGGRRAEALLVTGITLGYALLSSAFYSPFGGFSPGPRYLIVVLPFLALPLASALRTAPLVTGALAAVSVAAMTLLTATHPQAGYDGAWADRLRAGDIPLTAASLAGVTGRIALLPLLVGVLAAAWLALRVSGAAAPVGRWDPVLAGAAVLAWAGLAAIAPEGGSDGITLYVLLGLLALVGAAALVPRPRARLRERPALR